MNNDPNSTKRVQELEAQFGAHCRVTVCPPTWAYGATVLSGKTALRGNYDMGHAHLHNGCAHITPKIGG